MYVRMNVVLANIHSSTQQEWLATKARRQWEAIEEQEAARDAQARRGMKQDEKCVPFLRVCVVANNNNKCPSLSLAVPLPPSPVLSLPSL